MLGLPGPQVSRPPGTADRVPSIATGSWSHTEDTSLLTPEGLVSLRHQNAPSKAGWWCLWRPGCHSQWEEPCQSIPAEIPRAQSPTGTKGYSEGCFTKDVPLRTVRGGHHVCLDLPCPSLSCMPGH